MLNCTNLSNNISLYKVSYSFEFPSIEYDDFILSFASEICSFVFSIIFPFGISGPTIKKYL